MSRILPQSGANTDALKLGQPGTVLTLLLPQNQEAKEASKEVTNQQPLLPQGLPLQQASHHALYCLALWNLSLHTHGLHELHESPFPGHSDSSGGFWSPYPVLNPNSGPASTAWA